VTPIALCGGAFAVAALRRWCATRSAAAAALAPLAILPFASTIWLLALPDEHLPPAQARAAAATATCLTPGALAPLASLPAGSIVAPLDVGAHILESTRSSVFAAPYHRNDDGNRFAFQVFLAPPEVARDLLAARHVAYVLTCPGMAETDRVIARAPQGLAARLAAGVVPGFLRPVPLVGTPFKVYAVAPDGT
jgi:hypothetical protein